MTQIRSLRWHCKCHHREATNQVVKCGHASYWPRPRHTQTSAGVCDRYYDVMLYMQSSLITALLANQNQLMTQT
eukprot:COSAG01_NODE_32_length_35644_cov_22.273738_24_plen_74_part_00